MKRATNVGKQGRRLAQPKQGSPLWVTYDKLAVENLQIVDEWGVRGRALVRMAPYLATEATYRNLMGLIPTAVAWNSYRRAFRTATVGSPRLATYAVYVRPTVGKDVEIDGKKEALYIRPRRSRLRPISKAIETLAKFSPWTLSTLPYSPKRNEAVTVTRRASPREIKSIEEQRKKDQPVWRRELEQAGVRVDARAGSLTKVDTKVVSDVGFAGLRLEFGYGGTKRVPHWRPSIRIAIQSVMRRLQQDKRFSGLLTAKGSSWKKWPPTLAGRLSPSDLKRFAKFQHRVASRL